MGRSTRRASPGRSRIATALAVTPVCALLGCWGHQTVPSAPPRGAPYAARAAAYAAWRPQTLHTTTYLQSGTVTQRTTDRLTLANGTAIVHPEDLIPMTGDPSPFADRARSAGSVNRRFQALLGTGVGLALAGGGVLLAWRLNDERPVFGDDGAVTLGVGLGAIGVGLLVGLVGGLTFAEPSRVARLEAFEAYDEALRANLGLCDETGRDCPERTPQSAEAPRAPSCPALNGVGELSATAGPFPERLPCVDALREAGAEGLQAHVARCVPEVVQSASAYIRGCYERCRQVDPRLAGSVELRFTLSPRGEPTNLSWRGLEGAPAVGECIAAVVSSLPFPPASGSAASFSVPFSFGP